MIWFAYLNYMFAKKTKAFSLVELMVVIAVIALLMGILMPALSTTRAQVKATICQSNIRQLLLANIGYSTENDGFYVPAASDIWDFMGGLHRWHGVRDSHDEPFDPLKGPLVAYLADGKVKECPERVRFVKGQGWSESFEKGCGGYGYNMTYIGSRMWSDGYIRSAYETATKDYEINRPTQTLMFADTAFYNDDQHLIEYSFAEQPYYVYKGKPMMSFYMSPSIHFRHRGRANIGWADGHVGSQEMAKFDIVNPDGVKPADMMLGWFEPIDNSQFDLE